MDKTIKERFDELKIMWLEETKNYSRITHIIGHPCYEDIIDMGPAVLPFIIEELRDGLKSNPPIIHNWFFALQKLTNDNPIHSSEWGDLKKMAQRWVDWAEENSEKIETKTYSLPMSGGTSSVDISTS